VLRCKRCSEEVGVAPAPHGKVKGASPQSCPEMFQLGGQAPPVADGGRGTTRG